MICNYFLAEKYQLPANYETEEASVRRTERIFKRPEEISKAKDKVRFLRKFQTVKKQDPYLSILFHVLEAIPDDVADLGNDQQKFFQVLAVLCMRPKFLFGSPSEPQNGIFYKWEDELQGKQEFSYHYDAYKKYKKEIKEFYQKSNKLAAHLRVLNHYTERITKRLKKRPDKSSSNTRSEELRILVDNINRCYSTYYYSLCSLGMSCPTTKPPKVDEKLLRCCLENVVIYPLAHVVMLRDAQYHIMKLGKHWTDLLDGTGKPFLVG